MTMMKYLALAGCVATLVLAGAAFAHVGNGNTIAGPGSVTLADTEVLVVVSGLDGEDICVTLQNRRKKGTAAAQVTITDDVAATSSVIVNRRQTLSICMTNAVSVSVTCMGPSSCPVYWCNHEAFHHVLWPSCSSDRVRARVLAFSHVGNESQRSRQRRST